MARQKLRRGVQRARRGGRRCREREKDEDGYEDKEDEDDAIVSASADTVSESALPTAASNLRPMTTEAQQRFDEVVPTPPNE